MSENPVWIVVGMMIMLMLMFGVAYYFEQGEQSAPVTATAKQKPVKKFRAKPGTERDNVRALTSAQPSVKEETTKADIEIWGSLEGENGARRSGTESLVRQALSEGTPEEGARVLLDELKSPEEVEQPGLIYAALATMYWAMDPPMTEEAEKALALAWETASSPVERLEVIYVQAAYALSQGDVESLMDTLTRVGEYDLPPSAHLLELGVMLGVGYEELGQVDEALSAYESVLADAEVLGLERHPGAADVYRQAGLRLAALLREQGDDRAAKALALSVQRSLDF